MDKKKGLIFGIVLSLVVICAAVIILVWVKNNTCLFGEHIWTEADCLNPKICQRCGIVEGEKLGHTPSKANYQEASYCERCHVKLGDKLEPYFQKEGITHVLSAQTDTEYEYHTMCTDEAGTETTGTMVYSDYSTFVCDKTHDAKYGYEWQHIRIDFSFAEDAVWTKGITWNITTEDYYDDTLFLKSLKDIEGSEGRQKSFTVNYYGKNYTECIKETNVDKKGWVNKVYYVSYDLYFLVPKGYDGIVVAARNPKIQVDSRAKLSEVISAFENFIRLDKKLK